ncbi:MAG: hypothetical protein WCT39_00050 [Candidatus Margulisiibacteriota bacterium]
MRRNVNSVTLVCTLALLLAIFYSSLFTTGCGSTTETTTTTSSTTTTTQRIRLYYTIPSPPDYTAQQFCSAVSSDGINFSTEAGTRLADSYLSDPDVIKLGANNWSMFYSKAFSTDPLINTHLYRASARDPKATFEADASFSDLNLGSVSSSIMIGSTPYLYLVYNGVIRITTYSAATDSLTFVAVATSGGASEPTVIRLTDGTYKMYYKVSSDTYQANSTDGLVWDIGSKLYTYAKTPGAICINGKIYLYYVNTNTSDVNNGKIMVVISSNNGATFGTATVVNGLQTSACDPYPVAYE